MLAPNRIAVYLTALAALGAALAPVVADMDWTSTAGVIAGVLGLVTVVTKWLDGWQAYERDVRQGKTVQHTTHGGASTMAGTTYAGPHAE